MPVTSTGTPVTLGLSCVTVDRDFGCARSRARGEELGALVSAAAAVVRGGEDDVRDRRLVLLDRGTLDREEVRAALGAGIDGNRGAVLPDHLVERTVAARIRVTVAGIGRELVVIARAV